MTGEWYLDPDTGSPLFPLLAYSPYINAIAEWLRRNGIAVHLQCRELPDDVAGRYDDDAKTICIASFSARDALLTIAHEAGHWLGYLIDPKPESHQREWQAYVYGWYVLQWFEAPITRAEWVEECQNAAFDRKQAAETRARELAYESYDIDAELEALGPLV